MAAVVCSLTMEIQIMAFHTTRVLGNQILILLFSYNTISELAMAIRSMLQLKKE